VKNRPAPFGMTGGGARCEAGVLRGWQGWEIMKRSWGGEAVFDQGFEVEFDGFADVTTPSSTVSL
jgi:hypothetical protein